LTHFISPKILCTKKITKPQINLKNSAFYQLNFTKMHLLLAKKSNTKTTRITHIGSVSKKSTQISKKRASGKPRQNCPKPDALTALKSAL
jgi:hypothetical protein